MTQRIWILKATNGYAKWTKYYKGRHAVGDALHDVEEHRSRVSPQAKWTFTLVSGRIFL